MAEHGAELARSNAALEQFGYVVPTTCASRCAPMKSYMQKLAERYQGRLDAAGRRLRHAQRQRRRPHAHAHRRPAGLSRACGRQGKEPAPVDCGVALAAACANLQAAIEESGADVTADRLPAVWADPTQLVQLFQNLVANALKFRDRAGRRASTSAPAARTTSWVVTVADNGIGIEPQYLQRIFGLGERLHSASQVPRQRHRPGHLREDRPAPRRPHLGRLSRPGPGQHLLVHAAAPARGTLAPSTSAGSFTTLNQKCSIDLTTLMNWSRSTGLVT